MTIIGKPDGKVTPTGYLKGPAGNIPIDSFAASLTVGNIPVARVGIPPEYLSQLPDDADTKTYDVMVGDGTAEPVLIFRGYVCGPSGRLTPTDIRAGVDLIHVARDLDQMRLSAPNLHPQSCNDWSYQRSGSARVAGASGQFELGSAQFFSASAGTPLATQVIKELIRFMQEELTVTVDRGNSAYAVKSADLQPAITLLQSIKTVGGGTVRASLATLLANPDQNSINGHLVNVLNDSFQGQRSIWDALTAAFADFGLYLLCDNAGNVFVVPDLANFQPPQGNLLDGTYIVTRDQASSFYRRVGEVMLISQGVRPDPGADGGTETYACTIASYPPPATGPSQAPSTGATLSLLFPGWLAPIGFVVDPASLKAEPPNPSNPGNPKGTPADTGSQRAACYQAQVAYAQMLFNQESDKKRTFSVTGPLAPLAVPGTTVRIQPFSNVVAKTSGQDISGLNSEYWCYLYQVQHNVECSGRSPTLTTTFNFRNVSESDEGLGLTNHPIYSDVAPFTLQ